MRQAEQESAIIVAGGRGLRAGGELPKQFRLIGERPLLMHAIDAFHRYNPAISIVVVLPESLEMQWKERCKAYHFTIPHGTTTGGDTRFHSVRNGLKLISPGGLVAVHDAARPLVTPALIGRCFTACAAQRCGVIPVLRVTDSVRLLTDGGSRLFDREQLRVVQTPQVFPVAELMEAYDTVFDPSFTDDASVAEKHGLPIRLVEGEENNIKITTPFDFLIAEQYLRYLPK